MRETRIAPSAAKPITTPLKRMVPDIPDAFPACDAGMTVIPTLRPPRCPILHRLCRKHHSPQHIHIMEVRRRECHQQQTAAEDHQSASQSVRPENRTETTMRGTTIIGIARGSISKPAACAP